MSMISNFTVQQKVDITTGAGWANGLCVGYTPPVGNFPGLCLQDSALGVRDISFPSGITTASTLTCNLANKNAGVFQVDDRTQQEIHAHLFIRPVMAGVSSVMWSHNLDNDTYACNNNKTLNDIMKHKFGFQGCTSYFGQNLTDFVMNSAISMQRLDDMVKRIIAAWYFLHQEEGYPNVTVSSFNFYNPLIRSSSKEGRRPPVRKPKSIILVGSDAGTNNFTYLILSPPTKPFKHAPEWIRPVFSGTSMTGISPMQATPSLAWRPLLFLLAPTRGYVTVDGNAAYSSIAAQNNNTIVVTNSGSFDHRIEPWVDHPNVTIVWANLGGKEAGNAITDILYGACVYIAKQGNSHSDVTTCFNSLKKVMQEFRSMAASEAQLQMAQSSMRPSAVTLTTDPGAAFAVDFDAMVANWDEYPNIGNDKGGAEEGSSDDEYDPNAKILKGKAFPKLTLPLERHQR
ncbi:glycoside hydrolase superfamily [Suillus placidus]|uniref:beta-glucosidase n=1 Tax=Suillus placidus TaxID=48579 RepID=A0A9P7CVX7_9AGAM|nr:glycoside hydrolase superfamily [Suillus placidus]